MRNWLGQELKGGVLVYRGARDGDSSSFRIGRVLQVKDMSEKVRVRWLHEKGTDYKNSGRDRIATPIATKPWTDESTVDGNTLVVISEDVLDTLRLTPERQAEMLGIS